MSFTTKRSFYASFCPAERERESFRSSVNHTDSQIVARLRVLFAVVQLGRILRKLQFKGKNVIKN